MRRKVVVAVLAAALVGAVGAEGILKAREAFQPKGRITVEEVDSVIVTANANSVSEQLPALAQASM